MDGFNKMAEASPRDWNKILQVGVAALGCILSYLGLIALLAIFNLSAEDLDMSKNPVSHGGYSSYAILVVIGGSASLLKCILVTIKTVKLNSADGKDDEGYTLQTLRHLSASLCVLIGGLLLGQMETDSEISTDSQLYGWVVYFVVAMGVDKLFQLLTDFDDWGTIFTPSHSDKCDVSKQKDCDKRVPQGVARSLVIYLTTLIMGLSLAALVYFHIDVEGKFGDYNVLPYIGLGCLILHVVLALVCVVGDAMERMSSVLVIALNEIPAIRSVVALTVLLTLSISTGQMVSLDQDNAWQFMALCLYFISDIIGRNVV
jgi:hypothetical protein